MDYTTLLHLLSSLSWNISSDSEDIIPICSDTNQSSSKKFFIYHDGFSQNNLKQHNCSCQICTHGKITIQHLTLINKNKTSLGIYDSTNTEKILLDAEHLLKWSFKPSNSTCTTIKFIENGGISQFLLRVSKGDPNTSILCNQNLNEIIHPGVVEAKDIHSTVDDQIHLPTRSNNYGWILIGIGIFMIIASISLLIGVIFLRKSRQMKKVPEKVINTHIVSEIIPEKTAEIKSTKVSESTPCAEDYEFCEIPEYYSICKEKPDNTVPNLPSKPPPIKQEPVDISSDTGDRNSNTQIDQTSTSQTELYSNFQMDSKSLDDHQRETTNEKIVNSNQSERYSVDVKPLKTGEDDYDNLDDIEDTYNHLEDVLSPKPSLNKSFTEEPPNKSPSQNDEISGDVEIMMLDDCDNSDVKDKKKPTIKGQAENNSSYQDDDNVKLRTTGSSSSRSHSDTKVLENSVHGQFDNVVCELVQRSKSCTSTVDKPEMIIIENDLYESMDG